MTDSPTRPDDWYDPRFDPYMLAVGKIATVWAWNLPSTKPSGSCVNVEAAVGACVTAQLIGPDPRMRALLALLDLRRHPAQIEAEEKLLSKFRKLSERIDGFGRQRNSYVHQYAIISEEGNIRQH
jgi:hypothetical protein